MDTETVIHSIEEYLGVVFKVQGEIASYNQNPSSTFHQTIAFRGQENKDYELIPAIGRDRLFSVDTSILNQERNLIEIAKHKLPFVFKQDLMPIDMLALLQHYGIPTRLMDVTSNPLVSLYFATSDDSVDGEVIIFEYNDSYKANYPMINAIADSYHFIVSTPTPVRDFYKAVTDQQYFDEERNEIENETIEESVNRLADLCQHILFVDSMEQLKRQRIQQGFYILFPNYINETYSLKCFDKIIKPIPKDHKQIIKRIIYPKKPYFKPFIAVSYD